MLKSAYQAKGIKTQRSIYQVVMISVFIVTKIKFLRNKLRKTIVNLELL